ncbi:MAG: phytoene/squalene synthase family protein [Burkholderiales bacterium]|nr:MAG: phytoene/squalene synthase family protein [Burkholderiales bacterium]
MNDAAVLAHATRTINAGSQSFAAAARLFRSDTRESAVMLYTWCRYCDDVVDGQELGHGQLAGTRTLGSLRMAQLEHRTRAACEGQADDAVFRGLAEVVRRHGIPQQYLLEHLAGFRMDVEEKRFVEIGDTLLYCWRVAGVIGVMMSMVMGERDPRTLDRACDLGMAFQLTNIARDIVEDAAIGRVYIPQAWLEEEGLEHIDDILDPAHRAVLARLARRLVDLADPYYQSAVAGIGKLPLRSAWSIATARGVYRAIGLKVVDRGAHAWDSRTSTSKGEKLWQVARGAAVAVGARYASVPARPAELFTRPM